MATQEVPSSTKQTLRLKELTVESFGGIGKGQSLVIVIPPEAHFIGFTGDQGVGKSSALAAILAALGMPIPDNMINLQEQIANSSVCIEKNGVTYTASARKKKGNGATYTLTMKNQDDVTSKVTEPKTQMLNLVGNVFINPMDLKNMEGNKQIAWLRDLMKFGQAEKDFERRIFENIKANEKERADISRNNTSLKNTMVTSGFFTWDAENKCLVTTASLADAYEKTKDLPENNEELNNRFMAAMKKKNDYEKAAELIQSLKTIVANQISEIEMLEKQLAEKKQKMADTEKRIVDGAKYLEDNKTAMDEFNVAMEAQSNYSKLQMLAKQVKDCDAKLFEYNEGTSQWNEKAAAIDQLRESHKTFIQTYTPDIEGLEVVTAGAIDNERPEGLYYAGKPISMLSESEVWSLHVKLLEFFKIGLAVIENISSLGSAAIEVLNWFAKEKGGYIAYSQMERGQESLKVEFYEELI